MVTTTCIYFLSKYMSMKLSSDILGTVAFFGCVVDVVGLICTYKYLIALLAVVG